MKGRTITFLSIFGELMDGLVVNDYGNMLCVETEDGDICEITLDRVVYC